MPEHGILPPIFQKFLHIGNVFVEVDFLFTGHVYV